MMRKLSVLGLSAIFALALGASAAQAAPITGFISFGGNYEPVGGTQATATGVDILTDQAIVTCAFPAGVCQGTYAALNGNVVVANYYDFDFNPLGGNITPLWEFSFGGIDYSFDLQTVNIDQQDDQFLNLSGSGILRATGFDDTLGTWSFSGDTTNGVEFAFSATNSVVPEPASALLLGMALLGGARAYRRRKA